MNNDLRGEISLALGGKDFVLRPSFSALRKLETITGIGVLALIVRLGQSDVRLSDVAAATWAGIVGSKMKDPPSLDEVGDLILETGMITILPQVATFLTAAIQAGRKEGDAKKEETKTMTMEDLKTTLQSSMV